MTSGLSDSKSFSASATRTKVCLRATLDLLEKQFADWKRHTLSSGYGATDPTLLGDNTTDAIQLAKQFDAALASYYPYLTLAERQLVAQQYPIEDAPEAGNNTFQRIEQVIGDSTFICPVRPFFVFRRTKKAGRA